MKPSSSLSIDFETRAVVDLKKTGVYPYAAHKHTDIWVMAWAFDDEEPQVWIPRFAWAKPEYTNALPQRILDHIAAGGEIRAWNAQFERVMWEYVMVPRYGAPRVPLEQWVDTAAEAAAMALPRHLDGAAKVTKVAQQKDNAGYRLMLRMTRPKNRKEAEAGADPVWHDEPDKLQQLYEYCKQDVRTERAMVKVLRRLVPREREIYLLDQRLNDRGVRVDRELVVAAQAIVDEAVLQADDKIFQITKGEVDGVTSAPQMRKWLGVESIAKPVLKEMLAGELTEAAREVLQLRSDVGRSSVAKLQSMLDFAMDDDRMRGMLLYHAAGTGRWGGKGPQPQNFPRGGEIENIEQYIPLVLARDYDAIEKIAPPVILIMEMLRSMMAGAPGHELIAADYSAIEARVLNWLAGQHDVLENFRRYDETKDPQFDQYVRNAMRIYSLPLDEIEKFPHRHTGKFQELGCGFQMGAKKAVTAAKDVYGIEITEAQGKEIVDDYRASHQKVVQLWYDAENAVVAAVDNPGVPIRFGEHNRITAIMKGSYLYLGLPSGRPLAYAAPKVVEAPTPWGTMKRGVEFLGVNSKTKQWGVQRLYGGLIVENIVQAVSRDIMAEGMDNVEKAGYPPILTVHDEVVSEVPVGFGSVEEYQKLLTTLPPWAAGCPLTAEGWRGTRYRK